MKSLGKRKTVLFVLIATALMLLMIEGASRGAYTFLRGLSHVRRDRWFLYSPEVGWMPRPNFSGPAFGGGTREFDENSFLRIDSEQVKDRTDKKVLFLGDSNTFGWKVSTDSTFVEHVDRNLPGVSAINAGVIGYTSYQGLKTLERIGSRVQPDIVVASFNFNDRRWVRSFDHADSKEKFYRMSNSHNPLLDWSYFVKGVRWLRDRSLGRRDEGPVHADVIQPRVSPEEYRRNLNRIADLCNQLGAVCLLMVLNDNPVHTAYTRKGTEQMAVGDVLHAIDSFKIAMGKGQTWNSVVARFQLINAYHSAGKNDEAEQLNEFDGAYYDWMGGMPMFADGMYNNIMRDVARERGLGLVEAGMLLNEFPSDYYDHCHPDANGHRKIAVILKDSILKALAENTYSRPTNEMER